MIMVKGMLGARIQKLKVMAEEQWGKVVKEVDIE